MQNEWILDVLSDLKTFACQNGHSTLAEHLDDMRIVAATELTVESEGNAAHECATAKAAGDNFGGTGTRL